MNPASDFSRSLKREVNAVCYSVKLLCSKILQLSLVSNWALKIVVVRIVFRLSLVVCVGPMNPKVFGSNSSKNFFFMKIS